MPTCAAALHYEEHGSTGCRVNESYGCEDGAIWVSHGCRGAFSLGFDGALLACSCAQARAAAMCEPIGITTELQEEMGTPTDVTFSRSGRNSKLCNMAVSAGN